MQLGTHKKTKKQFNTTKQNTSDIKKKLKKVDPIEKSNKKEGDNLENENNITQSQIKPVKQHRKKNASAEKARKRLTNILEVESERTTDAVDVSITEVVEQDTMSMQNVVSLLLTIILCITSSYLAVTFAGDRLAMHWMGV